MGVSKSLLGFVSPYLVHVRLLSSKCDLEQIPAQRQPASMHRLFNILGEMDRPFESLLTIDVWLVFASLELIQASAQDRGLVDNLLDDTAA